MNEVLIAFGAALLSLCCASAVAQQSKTLLLDRPLGSDPVRVVRAMEGATELKSDGKNFPNRYAWETTFSADDDWLKEVSFIIKNVSDKTITYLEVDCNLFETSDWQKELAAHSTPANPAFGQANNIVGWRPEHALYSVRLGRTSGPDTDKRPAFELAPGQQFTISLQDPKTYSLLKSSVEARQSISTINGCDGGLGAIFFADGTQWQSHKYLRPTEGPKRYELIPANERPQINDPEVTK
jgi:hypothetical protein